jgi:hypothetical protein
VRGGGILISIIVGIASAPGAAADLSGPATYTVTLQCGDPVPLNSSAVPSIYSWAIDLVRSSEGNSEAPGWVFPVSEVNQEYRDALDGDFLRVDLTPSAAITTLRGAVNVSTILVRLNPHSNNWRSKYPDHFMDSLFSVNPTGVVVGHALYSGAILYGLFGVVGQAISAPGACKREEKSFLLGLHFAHSLPPPTLFSQPQRPASSPSSSAP